MNTTTAAQAIAATTTPAALAVAQLVEAGYVVRSTWTSRSGVEFDLVRGADSVLVQASRAGRVMAATFAITGRPTVRVARTLAVAAIKAHASCRCFDCVDQFGAL